MFKYGRIRSGSIFSSSRSHLISDVESSRGRIVVFVPVERSPADSAPTRRRTIFSTPENWSCDQRTGEDSSVSWMRENNVSRAEWRLGSTRCVA